MHSPAIRAVYAIGVSVVLLMACRDRTTEPIPVGTLSESQDPEAELITAAQRDTFPDVQRVVVPLPPEPRSWDNNIDALFEAVMAMEGKAMVGFKAPGSPRWIETGVREFLPGDVFRNAVDSLAVHGVRVVKVLENVGTAIVEFDTSMSLLTLSAIASHPFVDYIEPDQIGHLAGTFRPSSEEGTSGRTDDPVGHLVR